MRTKVPPLTKAEMVAAERELKSGWGGKSDPLLTALRVNRGKPTERELEIERARWDETDQGLRDGLENGASRKMPVRYE